MCFYVLMFVLCVVCCAVLYIRIVQGSHLKCGVLCCAGCDVLYHAVLCPVLCPVLAVPCAVPCALCPVPCAVLCCALLLCDVM
jgi:hypothetical protein